MATKNRSLIRYYWILSAQLGFDPLRFFRSILGIPSFIRDLLTFVSKFKGRVVLFPCLHDRHMEGGSTNSDYFWQDLIVARWIYEDAPVKHVDIGSRVDGFVAHVASYRSIEVFDVRPITAHIPGIVFRWANVMDFSTLSSASEGYCDSLSCLHALEHFGLGRYGDPINPDGYILGLKNMAQLLRPDGVFYLSVPIGHERVEFNANWVFDPRKLIRIANSNQLQLKSFHTYDYHTGLNEISPTDESLAALLDNEYRLGIFRFTKKIEVR